MAFVDPAVSNIIQFERAPPLLGGETNNVLSLADKCTTLSSLVLPVASEDRLSINIYHLLTRDPCYSKNGTFPLTEPQVGQEGECRERQAFANQGTSRSTPSHQPNHVQCFNAALWGKVVARTHLQVGTRSRVVHAAVARGGLSAAEGYTAPCLPVLGGANLRSVAHCTYGIMCHLFTIRSWTTLPSWTSWGD